MPKRDPIMRFQMPGDPGTPTGTAIVAQAAPGYTKNADTVDNFHAYGTATANHLLALNSDSKLPASITGDAGTVDGYEGSQLAVLAEAETITGAWTFNANVAAGAGITFDGWDLSEGKAAPYVTLAASAALANERVLTAGDGLDLADGGAGGAATLAVDVTDILGNGMGESANNVFCYALRQSDDGAAAMTADAAGALTMASTLTVAGGAWIGLGAAAGRIEFDNQATDEVNLLACNVGVNTQSPAARLHVVDTAMQLRLGYDSSHYADLAVDAVGTLGVSAVRSLELEPAGDIVTDPNSKDILPGAAYDVNIGSPRKKYLTLHVAELWVESLIAQETIATIGGRILVGPTTYLTRTMTPVDTTIYVAHNQMRAGDVAYLESSGRVEFLSITSSPTAAAEELTNGDFESSLTGWTQSAGTGSITTVASPVHQGAKAAKLTAGSTSNTYIKQAVPATAGKRYRLEFWYGDDTNAAARFKIRDETAGVDIVTLKTTNLTGSTYERWEEFFTAPSGCSSVGIYLYCPEGNTYIAYFDDVSVRAAEYAYSVTRNLDGTGANQWHPGDAVFNTGTAGNGFIDLYSTWSVNARPVDFVFTYDASASSYSDNLSRQTGWPLFAPSPGQNDAIFFGVEGTAWENLYFYLTTAGAYSATLTWSYWNGSTWASFTPDTNDNFKSTGVRAVEWSAGDLTGWASCTINGQAGYYVQVVATSVTSWTTAPVQGGRRLNRGQNQYGPTVVGNIRQSSTFNDWVEGWAIGNLNGLYGYGSDVYGVGLGEYADGNAFLTIDAANGIRMGYLSSGTPHIVGLWEPGGDFILGDASNANLFWDASEGRLSLRDGTTASMYLDANGDVLLGNSSGANLFWDVSGGKFLIRNATTTNAYIDTDGSLKAGGGNVYLDSNGLQFVVPESASYLSTNSVRWMDGANVRMVVAAYESASGINGLISIPAVSSLNTSFAIEAEAPEGQACSVALIAANDGLDSASLVLGVEADNDTYALIAADYLRVTGDLRVATGLYVGDEEDPAAKRVVIDQGSEDGAILQLRSSDVDHGATTLAATDVYGWIQKAEANQGGLQITGFKEGGGSVAGRAVYIRAGLEENAATGATTGAGAIIVLEAGQLSDSTTTWADIVSNGNVLAVRARRGGSFENVFIIDEDGDYWSDGSAGTFDDYDDALAVQDLASGLAGEWQNVIAYNKELLREMGVIDWGPDGKVYVSGKRINMLMMGAIAQLYRRMEANGSSGFVGA